MAFPSPPRVQYIIRCVILYQTEKPELEFVVENFKLIVL